MAQKGAIVLNGLQHGVMESNQIFFIFFIIFLINFF